jgi:hypothetical protein
VCAVGEFRLVLFMHDGAVWREECEILAVVCDGRGLVWRVLKLVLGDEFMVDWID